MHKDDQYIYIVNVFKYILWYMKINNILDVEKLEFNKEINDLFHCCVDLNVK